MQVVVATHGTPARSPGGSSPLRGYKPIFPLRTRRGIEGEGSVVRIRRVVRRIASPRRFAATPFVPKGVKAFTRNRGKTAVVRCATDAGACAAPWPLSGGCVRG